MKTLLEVHDVMRSSLLHAFAENPPQVQHSIANASQFLEDMMDAMGIPVQHRVGVAAVLMERYLARVLKTQPLFP